jgi:hypothetical protein
MLASSRTKLKPPNVFRGAPCLGPKIIHANATSSVISNAEFQKNDSRIDEQLSYPLASISLNLALNSIKSSDPTPVQTPKLFLHALRATIQIQKRHLSSHSSRIEIHAFADVTMYAGEIGVSGVRILQASFVGD